MVYMKQVLATLSIVQRCSVKKLLLKFRTIGKKTSELQSHFCRPQNSNFIQKETPTQVLPVNFAKILRITAPVAASVSQTFLRPSQHL